MVRSRPWRPELIISITLKTDQGIIQGMDDQFYSGNSRIDQHQIESSSGLDNVALRQLPDIPESFPGPIIGCLCASCKTFFRSAQLTNQAAVDFGNLGSIPKIQSSIKKFKNDLNKLTLLR